MRNLRNKKRFSAVAATVAAVLVGGGVAVAYWTTSGSGSGTAQIDDAPGITYDISATNGIDLLSPGASDTFDVVATNPTDGNLQVTGVDISVSGTSNVGCEVAWFTVTDIAGPITLTPGANTVGTATITMLESGTNQDACKNGTVDLVFADA